MDATKLHDPSGLEAHRHIDRSGLKQYGYRNRSWLKKQTAWVQKQIRAEEINTEHAWAQKQIRVEETNSMGTETDQG